MSIVQVGLEIALNRHVAGNGSASTTATLFKLVNQADLVKLVLLGTAIAAATLVASRVRAFPPWMHWLGYALMSLLIIGGLAFVIDSSALEAVLEVSLIALLVWAAAVGIIASRRGAAGEPNYAT